MNDSALHTLEQIEAFLTGTAMVECLLREHRRWIRLDTSAAGAL